MSVLAPGFASTSLSSSPHRRIARVGPISLGHFAVLEDAFEAIRGRILIIPVGVSALSPVIVAITTVAAANGGTNAATNSTTQGTSKRTTRSATYSTSQNVPTYAKVVAATQS